MTARDRLLLAALVLIAAASGGAVVALATLEVPSRAALRGLALGVAGGLFGAALFCAGALLGRYAWTSGGAPAGRGDARTPAVSPEEAKFWLQRFLEEHQPPRKA